MKAAILGSSGFVGKNLLLLIRQKCLFEKVLNVSRSEGVDLLDCNAIKTILVDFAPDVIFNLASHGGSLHYVTKNSAQVITDNIRMMINLYDAVKDLKNRPLIINPISNCSYPSDSSIQEEGMWLNGDVHSSVFSFAGSKRSLYYISGSYHIQYGIKSINLIFPNAYGPNDSTDPNRTHALNGMIIRMIKAQKNDEKEFVVWGSGNPVREWIYVSDFCELLLMALKIDKPIIYPVNMGQNKGYSIKQTASLIKKICGYRGDITFDTKYPDGDPLKILDNKKFGDLFGDYVFFDHEIGIINTVDYYKKML